MKLQNLIREKIINVNAKITIVAICIVAASSFNGFAAGLLIADGGFGGVLTIKEHDVAVTINNGIAVTKVTEVFHNTENRQVEALYTFPVPKGASIANFSMWINGTEMVGEVVEKERARRIYNSYKKVRRDPGLLEQVDYKTFELRIFPIAPNADQKIEITYYQELEVDHDWANYVYPLATATKPGIDSKVRGKFSIRFEVLSEIPIAKMESPSHPEDFVLIQHNDSTIEASLETPEGSLARDVVLSYNLKRPKTGIDLITSNQPGDDGYFQITMTVGEDLAKLDRGMDYVFILDVSGSMANDGKLLLSRDAVSAFINALSTEDRFEVMSFNIRPSMAFNSLQSMNDQNKGAALQFLAGQRAKGGTELKPALLSAFRYGDSDRPLNVVILSDGMTEQRERAALLQSIQSSPPNCRVFCIGVGNEVNRPLLEQIADDSGGLAAFISRGDNFGRQANSFRRKLMRPAAANLSLEFVGGDVYDVIPETLPNLYHGQPIHVYGRYRRNGSKKVVVRGTVQGAEFKKSEIVELPKVNGANPEIERMWAWHKIDSLQKEADRSGVKKQITDEIVRLGEGYSIVSEYTSFLVLENDAEYRRWKIDRKNAVRIERDRQAQKRLRTELDKIRNKAALDLGPAAPMVAKNRDLPSTSDVQNSSIPKTPPSNTSTQTKQHRGFDFDLGTGGGTGPVGPLFMMIAAWINRRKQNRSELGGNK